MEIMKGEAQLSWESFDYVGLAITEQIRTH